MKKSCLFLLLITLMLTAKAQSLAIINDKDGFVNVRKGPNAKSPIVGKLFVDDLFTLGDDEQDKKEWPKIYKQNEDGTNLEGYVHKSRIFYLSDFKKLKGLKVYPDSSKFKNDGVTVFVKCTPFKPKEHNITYVQSGAARNNDPQKVPGKIDGKHIWGTDEKIPDRAISLLKVTIHSSSINIPKNAFDDLYEPRLKSLTVYSGLNNTIYIEMDNSDGAGAYTVIWIIKNGKYLKRYIDDSNV